MVNFVDELVQEYGIENQLLNNFNIINMSNRLVYVEGQMGVLKISDEVVSFKVKKYAISIFGQHLKIKRINNTTLVVTGEINIIESK